MSTYGVSGPKGTKSLQYKFICTDKDKSGGYFQVIPQNRALKLGWLQWVRCAALGLLRSPNNSPSESPVTLTEEQTRLVATVQAAARVQVRCSATLEELRQTLYGCSWVSQVINMRDASGYNLLQTAIMVGRADIVEYLIGQGADLNSPICGRPLHLAARLGLTDVLDILLRLGADPRVTSAVCYPEPHCSDRLLYNPTTKEWGTTCQHDIHAPHKPEVSTSTTACDVKSITVTFGKDMFNYPLHYAIKRDSVDCVKHLEAHDADDLLSGELCLHTAAHYGAQQCVEYFISTRHSTITTVDGQGRTPLHRCLRHGKAMVQLLVQNGASLTCKTNQEETLLHCIFAEDVPISVMVDLCVYLLDCGLTMTINALDKDGNSALHNCLLRVHQSSPQTYAEWKDLEKCVMLLLEHKGNPNISNREGNTPLHMLLDIFRFENNHSVILPEFELKAEAIEWLLRLLLLHNANPSIANKLTNPSTPTNVTSVIPLDTPLMMFIHNLFFQGYSGWIYHVAKTLDSPQRLPFLVRFRDMCCNVIHTLGQPTSSIQQRGRSCPVKLLIRYLEYIDIYGQKMVTDEMSVSQNYLETMLEYLRAMLEVGFNPKDENEWILILETFSVLYEHKLVPFAILRDFLLVLLQYGAETNRSEYTMYNGVPALDMESFPIISLQMPFSKSRYTIDERLVLIGLFLSTMDRPSLRQCIAYRRPQRGTCSEVLGLNVLTDKLYKPLKLKALSAHAIRYSLNKKLAPNVKHLPLPNEIKNYLLQLQY